MSLHTWTHAHTFALVPGGTVKSCRWRLPGTWAVFGFQPDFGSDCPWYWVPDDLVRNVSEAENAYVAVALLRSRYREMVGYA